MFIFKFNSATIKIPNKSKKISIWRNFAMRHNFLGLLLIILFSFTGFAQSKSAPTTNIPIVAEEDATPPLLNNLPDAENARNRAVHIRNASELKKVLGERNVFDLISFEGGTSAVTAPYEEGKLLIVEFANPQFSIDADNKINQRLSGSQQNSPVYYRRV